jgi:hypothetical protein
MKSKPPLLLPQGKELQLPHSSCVKLPKIEAIAECKQVGAMHALAEAELHGDTVPLQ